MIIRKKISQKKEKSSLKQSSLAKGNIIKKEDLIDNAPKETQQENITAQQEKKEVKEPESFEKMIGLFEDIIASSECDLVIEKKREKLSIDGDVFNGIQMFAMFFKKITFTNIDFSIPKAQPNSKLFGARITRVVII